MSVPRKVCEPVGGGGMEDWRSRIHRPSAVPMSRTALAWLVKSTGAKTRVPESACLKPW